MTLEEQVLKRIKPGTDEKDKLQEVASELLNKVSTIARIKGVEGIVPKLVGSAARNTWISGTHDLDIFISFPESVSREELETNGLLIAREVARNAINVEERYAEHPYLNMHYKGFDVDLVPCFAVESASEIKSAVDRTPFHNEFIKMSIPGREDDVLIMKQFMKGTGTYGSELRTQGFSGYLTELLIVHYGSFRNLIRNACNWKPGLVIDMLEHGTVKHEDPLVVVDPTDPKRNVAAALSLNRFAQFIDACRAYSDNPSEEFFFPKPREPMSDDEVIEMITSRRSSFVAISFNTPDVVDDILYPQLDKMEQSICAFFEKYDFHVLNSGYWANEEAIVLIELTTSQLPFVKKHRGPPVWSREHAKGFKDKYKGSDELFSLYIEDGFYIADIRRKFTTAKELLEERIQHCSLGKHLGKTVESGFTILENTDIAKVNDSDFRKFLRKWEQGK
ncbi:CCA tRNA nucleotidyltransferase [Methanolobus bombayensis]|uniref:CCA tRNA nucleotidyltransferase n=1 Tax=Methanolobus bombayensis TaxID=38023 RepID=UPI001AE2779A|nr:CCA tRNA nucleotidyltransferase [Methanolobus bombayensis]MBP1909292.1 tRNA nucleotidyltransferase (CCA-adding enzyme) [Methanolobus bombayensis]